MYSMQRSATNSSDKTKPITRVRFQDQAEIMVTEIQRIDQSIPKEIDHDTSRNDESNEDSSSQYNIVQTPCTFPNPNNKNKKYGPIKKPSRIPSYLFNTLPVPVQVESPSSMTELRWGSPKTARSQTKNVAPSDPVRISSIVSILDNALNIVGPLPTSSTAMGVLCMQSSLHQDLSSQQNQVWHGEEYGSKDNQ